MWDGSVVRRGENSKYDWVIKKKKLTGRTPDVLLATFNLNLHIDACTVERV